MEFLNVFVSFQFLLFVLLNANSHCLLDFATVCLNVSFETWKTARFGHHCFSHIARSFFFLKIILLFLRKSDPGCSWNTGYFWDSNYSLDTVYSWNTAFPWDTGLTPSFPSYMCSCCKRSVRVRLKSRIKCRKNENKPPMTPCNKHSVCMIV